MGGLRGLKNRSLSTANITALEPQGAEDGKKTESAVQQQLEDHLVNGLDQAGGKPSLVYVLRSGVEQPINLVLDISSPLSDAAAAIVDDSFSRCFTSSNDEPWNWNLYLMPLWGLGLAVRYLILFPIRLALVLVGFLVFIVSFAVVGWTMQGQARMRAERRLVQFMCQVFAASWTAVIKYHGPRPVPQSNRVWVANHSSMIDYVVLCSYSPFAAIMQLHPGWVGMVQKRYLNAMGCLWFNRTEAKDRALVSQRMRAHAADAKSTPLLIFPEGTCVNNEYCVMFKRGAFDLGATVCPIAIKYNKIFVDAFWNSKKQSFSAHLGQLMRSWALVCDVYFLEPQTKRKDETAQEFAERVQKLIADRARLKVAPWDGYLKYYNLGQKHPDLIEKQRRRYSDLLLQTL
ncbi:hypothetical protein H632_c615p1 [Helicosporidium sp. ATCC 50920]|nr:hypothetical protein H632_c615p1 [Helicosporidium sp. ATCC 50920]|eukprot:KDD75566.1 hypothetical protein H632_c615p1 [Helicosporidium sp. ATCC 50920]